MNKVSEHFVQNDDSNIDLHTAESAWHTDEVDMFLANEYEMYSRLRDYKNSRLALKCLIKEFAETIAHTYRQVDMSMVDVGGLADRWYNYFQEANN